MARRLLAEADAHAAWRIGSEAYECRLGLAGSDHRRLLVPEMERLIDESRGQVGEPFIHTLAFLKAVLTYPVPMDVGPGTARQGLDANWPARNSEISRLTDVYMARALTAAPGRNLSARAALLASMLKGAARSLASPHISSTTVDVPAVAAELVPLFHTLSGDEQYELLAYSWRQLAGAATKSILVRILDHRPDTIHPIQDLALLRLQELAPEEHRRLVSDEIRNPTGRFGIQALNLPPEDSFLHTPELDRLLVDRVAAGRPSVPASGGTAAAPRGGLDVELLAEYASSDVAEEVERLFRSRRPLPCDAQAAFLSYFLRTVPQTGARLLSETLDDRTDTGCSGFLLDTLARDRRLSVPEAVAIARLDDESAAVAASAAGALQHAGTGTAKAALWRRLEKWHQEPKPQAEMAPADAAFAWRARASLGRSLWEAILNGHGWLITGEDLLRLERLSVSEADVFQLRARRQDEASPMTLSASINGGTWTFTLAHLTLPSVDAVKARLSLYPAGTTVRWLPTNSTSVDVEAKLLADLRAFASGHGLRIVGPEPK